MVSFESFGTIRYDGGYLTCSKKLTGSQLSLPHGINQKKLKCETKNKMMSVIGVPLSWGSPVGKRNLRWEGFLEEVGFEPGVKDRRSDGWREWGGESREEWRGWRNESGSWFKRRGDAYLNERSVIFKEEMVGGRERVTTDEERVLRGGWREIRLWR